jgi:hypothetical protein
MVDELTYQKKMIESLKLLKDWSVWMVTVQAGLLSFIGVAKTHEFFVFSGVLVAASLFFAVSIVLAAWVLSSIPSVVRRLDNIRKFEDYKIYEYDWIPNWVTLDRTAILQHVFFVAGIILFFCAMVFGVVPLPSA